LVMAGPVSILEASNPLLRGISRVEGRVSRYRQLARDFYFRVLLSGLRCPQCGTGGLCMGGDGLARCATGHVFDASLEFEQSGCCCARLVKRRFHYYCGSCWNTVRSKFLFDGRVFDREYFRDAMREYRERARKKRLEIARLLTKARSEDLVFDGSLDLESVPGLLENLDAFVNESVAHDFWVELKQPFNMSRYRDHILSVLSWDGVLFSDIHPLVADSRSDRAFRFVTLVYLDHEREVELSQDGDDIFIQRVPKKWARHK